MAAARGSLLHKRVIIAASTSGDNEIVAAVASRKIVVLSYKFIVAAAVTVRWESGASGTALSGVMSFFGNGGSVCNDNPKGWFETLTGQPLSMELGGNVSVGGFLTYIEV